MGLINSFKKLVMGFNAKNIVVNKDIKDTRDKVDEVTTSLPTLDLTKLEVETILMMVKDANFKGEHVQKVYNLVLKLQTYYSKLP
jgi:hypothetical protein